MAIGSKYSMGAISRTGPSSLIRLLTLRDSDGVTGATGLSGAQAARTRTVQTDRAEMRRSIEPNLGHRKVNGCKRALASRASKSVKRGWAKTCTDELGPSSSHA